MSKGAYLDASVALRATLEAGLDPASEAQLAAADVLVTSRLSLVETSRALIRARELGRLSEVQRADVQHELDRVWSRCHVWEITPAICERAMSVAPATGLRTLDAIHLATFLEARRRLGPELELLTADDRLRRALTAP